MKGIKQPDELNLATETTLEEKSAPTSEVKTETPAPPSTGKRQATPSSTGSKKRPYRRTKRPKNYCDKSTVTTTTPTAETPVNVFDAVLGECEDLLKASLEAQRLGRLKMASAYQLLLHTRLVGLGKRFDRSNIAAPTRRTGDDDEEDEDEVDDDEDELETVATPGIITTSPTIQEHTGPASAAVMAPSPSSETLAPVDKSVPKMLPPALQQLTSILPSNLEMDASMMEHLARAAVELHHQRTGRKKSADGLLASPMTGLIGSSPAPSASKLLSTKGATADTKVAWSQAEQDFVNAAVKDKKPLYAIAKALPSKTEAQVKAFLKNQEKSAQTSALAEEMASPNSKKRGGRGRKPPTTAMNTVPNANLDAKSLLKGALNGA